MTSENVNHAGFERRNIQSIAVQIGSIKAPDTSAIPKSSPSQDYSQPLKGPAIPSSIGSHVKPLNESDFQDQQEALKAKLTNFDIRFGDEDLDESINNSFSLAENDQMSILVDRNPMAENHRIVESTLLELEDFSNIQMDAKRE
jgi:hypothetical protein